MNLYSGDNLFVKYIEFNIVHIAYTTHMAKQSEGLVCLSIVPNNCSSLYISIVSCNLVRVIVKTGATHVKTGATPWT